MNTRKSLPLTLILLGLLATPASAQLIDLIKQLGSTGAGVLSQLDQAASAPRGQQKTAAEIEAELAPDRQCKRLQERFNIVEKAFEYGGNEANLRLQRLIESDYKYNELTDEDRLLLRYLAKTTVWLPASLELRLGGITDDISGSPAELSELQRLAYDDLLQQADKFRRMTQDFPGEVSIKLNPSLSDGAFAKFGGRIQISPTMLNLMSEHSLGAEFVLAHEMAHIYKRHAIKHLQFSLLSSKEGWELGKKLLGRAQRGASFDPFRDGYFAAVTVPQLVTYVRGMQLRFNSEQELEADACAAQWLKLATIEPSDAWASFSSAFASGGYSSEHPATDERALNFAKRLDFVAPAAGPAKNKVDTKSIKSVLPAAQQPPPPKKPAR